MATLRIDVADDLKARAETRAAESGYETVEAYLEALMRADLEPGLDDPDLEQMLLHRLDSGPGIELTPEFAQQFKRQMRDRRGTTSSDAQ